MKTVFFSILADNYYDTDRTNEFINSFKKFHPDVPLKIFGQKEIDAVFAANPGVNFNNCKAAFAKTLYNDYELVVNIDIDHIVFDRLTEVLEGDYDIACPANFNRWLNAEINICCFDQYGKTDYLLVSQEKYLQAGLVASPRKDIWDLYYVMSLKHSDLMYHKDNDVLNLMVYLLPLNVKVLDGDICYDSPNFKAYYGCASISVENYFVVEDNQVKLGGHQVKLYHYARGRAKPPPQTLFPPDVWDFICSISKEPGETI